MKNDDLLKLLLTLNAEQVAIITAWAARYKADRLVEDETAAMLLKIINAALGTKVPYKRLKYPWLENAGGVAHFVQTTFPKLNKVRRYAVFSLCVSLIIDDLKQRGVPVTFGTIWVNMIRVAEVFENAYPGYRRAGLGKVILKAMERK